MKVQRTVLVAMFGLLMAAVPTLAHHSFSAEYDATKQIMVKGKFTKMEWVNPHSCGGRPARSVFLFLRHAPRSVLIFLGHAPSRRSNLNDNGAGVHSAAHGGRHAGPAGNLAGHERGGV